MKSSRIAVTRQPTVSRKNRAAPQVVQPPLRVDAAPHDDKRVSPFPILSDPLWGMAIASAILFVLLAALIASG
jgi:hypothetical protein